MDVKLVLGTALGWKRLAAALVLLSLGWALLSASTASPGGAGVATRRDIFHTVKTMKYEASSPYVSASTSGTLNQRASRFRLAVHRQKM